MRITIERLRTGIVVLAIALVAAIGVFLVVARYEGRRLIKDLPAKLGVQIQESADSFTVSKSNKDHTLFTIHASKAVQYKNGGHASLHDVSITLYGPKGDRADHIYGSDFDYDPKSGIASAPGEVEIDLQPPSAPGSPASPADGDSGKNTIHIKATGLVFDKNSGTATSSGLVEFRMPQGAGHATGASYDSQGGVLVLDSAVEVDSSSDGKALSLHASHAQMVRDSRQAFLLNPVVDYQSERTASDQAIVYLREDGSAQLIDAKGHIHVTSDGGEDLTAGTAKITLDSHSQPQYADLGGGLYFTSTDNLHHMRGTAVEGKLQFGEQASLHHLTMVDAVSFVDEQRTLPDDPTGSNTREVRAAQIDVDFTRSPEGRSMAQRVLATGNATVVLHTISSKHPQQNTTIAGDQLLATVVNGNVLNSMTGTGHTKIVDVAADGAIQTSTGDSLTISFIPTAHIRRATAKKAADTALPAMQIQSAIQQGNVAITQTAPTAKPGPAVHIAAQKAEYQAADQVLHLDGSPHFNDGSLDLSADSMEFQRTSGTATATGNVKATYLQQSGATTASASGHTSIALGGQGPAHIVANKATMNRSTGDAIFSGNARLWQGSNSISAPVIELSRTRQSLKAHSDPAPGGSGGGVEATLTQSPTAQRPASVDHIQSRELAYSEGDRQATFSGAVVAQAANGTIHSDQAVIYLVDSPAPAARPTASSNGPESRPAGPVSTRLVAAQPLPSELPSQIDHIVADGHILLEQPGRKATGDKLVYSALDGSFTLTGSPAAPPRLVDLAHGTVSGASLIFNSRDDSVSVSGGPSRAATDTRVRK